MGWFFWCFRRLGDGQFKAVPARVYDPFLRGEIALKPDADGKVRIAFIGGPCEDRQPLAVDTVELSAIEVNKKGFHTAMLRTKGMSEALQSVWAQQAEERARIGGEQAIALDAEAQKVRDMREQGVLVATAAFAKRRMDAQHRWKPTDVDVKALREIINKRAGRRVA